MRRKLPKIGAIVTAILLATASVAGATTGFFAQLTNPSNTGTSGTLVTQVSQAGLCTPYLGGTITTTANPPCNTPFLPEGALSTSGITTGSTTISNVGTIAAPSTTINYGNSCGLLAYGEQSPSNNDTAFPNGNIGPTSGPPAWGPYSQGISTAASTVTIDNQYQSPEPSSYTQALWFRTTASGGLISLTGSLSVYNTSGGYDEMAWVDPNGHVVAGLWQGGSVEVSSPGTYNNGAWHFLAITESPAGMNMYIDGALVATNTSVNTPQGISGFYHFGWIPPYGTSGGWTDPPTTQSLASGGLAGVVVVNSALSASQISALYNTSSEQAYINQANSYTPRINQPLDAASAYNFIRPSTTLGITHLNLIDNLSTNSGIPQNMSYNASSVSPYASGGGSTAFNGSSTYGQTTSNIPGPGTYTIGAWVQPSSANISGGIMSFGSTQTTGSPAFDRLLWIDPNGHFVMNDAVTSSVTVTAGQWYFVVGSESSAGTSLWVNGVLQGTNTSATTPQSYNGYWHLGYIPPSVAANDNWADPPTSSYFNGNIMGEFAIGAALSQSTINSINSSTSDQSYDYNVQLASNPSEGFAPNYMWGLDTNTTPAGGICNYIETMVQNGSTCIYPSVQGCSAVSRESHLSNLVNLFYSTGLPATENFTFELNPQLPSGYSGFIVAMKVGTTTSDSSLSSVTSQPVQALQL